MLNASTLQTMGEVLEKPKGTPRTLTEAIAGGLMDSGSLTSEDVARDTAPAVMDWLRQRFTAAMMAEDPAVQEAMKKLWASIKERA